MVYIEMNLFFDNDFDVYKIEKELNIKPSDCKRRNETRMSPFDKNKHCEKGEKNEMLCNISYTYI